MGEERPRLGLGVAGT